MLLVHTFVNSQPAPEEVVIAAQSSARLPREPAGSYINSHAHGNVSFANRLTVIDYDGRPVSSLRRAITWIDDPHRKGTAHNDVPISPGTKRIVPERPPTTSYNSLALAPGWVDGCGAAVPVMLGGNRGSGELALVAPTAGGSISHAGAQPGQSVSNSPTKIRSILRGTPKWFDQRTTAPATQKPAAQNASVPGRQSDAGGDRKVDVEGSETARSVRDSPGASLGQSQHSAFRSSASATPVARDIASVSVASRRSSDASHAGDNSDNTGGAYDGAGALPQQQQRRAFIPQQPVVVSKETAQEALARTVGNNPLSATMRPVSKSTMQDLQREKDRERLEARQLEASKASAAAAEQVQHPYTNGRGGNNSALNSSGGLASSTGSFRQAPAAQAMPSQQQMQSSFVGPGGRLLNQQQQLQQQQQQMMQSYSARSESQGQAGMGQSLARQALSESKAAESLYANASRQQSASNQQVPQYGIQQQQQLQQQPVVLSSTMRPGPGAFSSYQQLQQQAASNRTGSMPGAAQQEYPGRPGSAQVKNPLSVSHGPGPVRALAPGAGLSATMGAASAQAGGLNRSISGPGAPVPNGLNSSRSSLNDQVASLSRGGMGRLYDSAQQLGGSTGSSGGGGPTWNPDSSLASLSGSGRSALAGTSVQVPGRAASSRVRGYSPGPGRIRERNNEKTQRGDDARSGLPVRPSAQPGLLQSQALASSLHQEQQLLAQSGMFQPVRPGSGRAAAAVPILNSSSSAQSQRLSSTGYDGQHQPMFGASGPGRPGSAQRASGSGATSSTPISMAMASSAQTYGAGQARLGASTPTSQTYAQQGLSRSSTRPVSAGRRPGEDAYVGYGQQLQQQALASSFVGSASSSSRASSATPSKLPQIAPYTMGQRTLSGNNWNGSY